jgi:hypothetical protein
MAKVLLTQKNIEEHICRETSSLYVDREMIIPPGIKDYLQNIGITLRYGQKPVEQADAVGGTAAVSPETGAEMAAERDIAALTRRVVAILRDEYQVKDEQTLQTLCLQVVKQMDK